MTIHQHIYKKQVACDTATFHVVTYVSRRATGRDPTFQNTP